MKKENLLTVLFFVFTFLYIPFSFAAIEYGRANQAENI